MKMIGSILSSPLAQSIGWALLHLVWQGAIVAAILAAALALMSKRTANARYAISCAALALLPLLAGITAWRAYEEPPLPLTGGDAVLRTQSLPFDLAKAAAAHATRATLRSFGEIAHDALPNIVLLWLVGVTILSIRLVVSWSRIKKLARTASPASDTWGRTLDRLADALALRRGVAILESAAVEVPTVIGWLKPLILLPMSTISALKPEEIEMLLAHELAHIRRHDFFVNLMQTAAETLMFYHPAVWWMSHRIRIEREHCCDDMAIETCGSALRYARALTHLEELRARQSELALAANGGSLITRIRRLVASTDDAVSDTSRWGAAAAVLAVVIALIAIPSMPALAKRNADEKLPTTPPRKEMKAKPSTRTITVDGKTIVCDKDHDNETYDVETDDALDAEIEGETPEAPMAPMAEGAPVVNPAPMWAGVPMPAATPMVTVWPRAPMSPRTPMVTVSPRIAPMAMAFASRMVDSIAPAIAGMPSIAISPEAIVEGIQGGIEGGIRGGIRTHPSSRIRHRGIGKDGKLSVDDLITLRSVGVTPEYITQMRATGLGDLSLDDIVAMRVQGVTPDYVSQMRKTGFDIATADQIVSMRVQGVTPDYVSQMRAAGFEIKSIDKIVALRVQGVTPDYVSQMRKSGLEVKSVEDIITLRTMGVSPSYIRDMEAAGYHNLSARELVELRAQGVSPAFVKTLADAGYTNLTVRDLVRLAASGVNADFIRDMAQYKEKK
jgi:beta-lactamase regulating signal transducer with metallopeptidase domain